MFSKGQRVEVKTGTETKQGIVESWSMYSVSKEITGVYVVWLKKDGSVGKRANWVYDLASVKVI
jgi:hypothetical protein